MKEETFLLRKPQYGHLLHIADEGTMPLVSLSIRYVLLCHTFYFNHNAYHAFPCVGSDIGLRTSWVKILIDCKK